MFRNLRLTAAAALTVSVLVPALASAEVFHYRSSGDSAYANFFDTDPTGCVWTTTSVSASANRFRTEPGPSEPATWVDLSIYRFDICQGLYDYSLYASATVPDSAFRINGGLLSASLQATVDAYNWQTGAVETVAIDLTWIGDGDVSRGHSNNQYTYPGGRYMSRSNGSFRNAIPSGSVTLQSTNVIAEAESAYGSLSSSQSAFTTIYRSH